MVVSAMEGEKCKMGWSGGLGRVEVGLLLHKMMKEGLSNEVTFELRPKGGERVRCVHVSVTIYCQVVNLPSYISISDLSLYLHLSLHFGCLIDVSNLSCLKASSFSHHPFPSPHPSLLYPVFPTSVELGLEIIDSFGRNCFRKQWDWMCEIIYRKKRRDHIQWSGKERGGD